MKLKGPKKLVKRAAFAARILGINDFTARLKWSEKYSEINAHSDGSFTIHIYKDQPKYMLMESVAHEMTHLRQLKHGTLIELDNMDIWEGQQYLGIEYMSDEYFLAPWEMEARAMEAWLTHKWETRDRELY